MITYSALPTPALPDALPVPSVLARDRRQVEVKQAYQLPKPGEERTYQLDFFLFVPRHFGVSAATYPLQDFYQDATVYLRLDAPGRSLRELGDLQDPRSPLSQVHGVLPSLLSGRSPPTEPLASLCQLHAHELSEAVVGAFGGVSAAARNGTFASGPLFIMELQKVLDESQHALVAIRQVRAELEAMGPLCHPAVPRALGFAEEYASAALDEQVAFLSEAVMASEALRDGTGTGARALLVLGRFAVEEARLRVESGYAVPWDEPREYFTYRLGLLKKHLQQALYLNTRQLQRDNYLRNSAAMVGAGLAATWTFLAQAPMPATAVDGRAQMVLLASAVGAYMLKDRIKEWSREWLTRRLKLDDYSRAFMPDDFARHGLLGISGRARERVRFVKIKDLEPAIRDVRIHHRSVMGSALDLEEVIHYRRRITLRASDEAKLPEGFGVREILRLNVRPLISRLDDPTDSVSFYDAPTGRFTKGDLPKVYHSNLVLRISGDHAKTRWVTRTRLVLNQDGLVRVEPVLSQQMEGRLKD